MIKQVYETSIDFEEARRRGYGVFLARSKFGVDQVSNHGKTIHLKNEELQLSGMALVYIHTLHRATQD